MARRRPESAAVPARGWAPGPPQAQAWRFLDKDAAAEWIRANIAVGAEFSVATSIYAGAAPTGYWTGSELAAKRGVLKRLDTEGLIAVLKVGWRGAVCRRER